MVAIILLTLEILTFLVLKEHFYNKSKAKFFISLTISLLLSLFTWYYYIIVLIQKGPYDSPVNVWHHMCLTGMMCGVVFPRFLLSLFHYLGKIIRIRKGDHLKGMTVTGLILSAIISIGIAYGTFFGRFNFKTEEITVKVRNLKPGLNGLRIVQISDLHLGGFYNHHEKLRKAIDIINNLKPDILINTGDFVTFGWREFDNCETILSKAGSRYGNFAIIGNHDIGTYLPGISAAERDSVALKVHEKIVASGYQILYNNSIILDIDGAKVSFTGVTTGGRHPLFIHGDVRKAMEDADSPDFRIFLCHDPNQWEADVVGKTDIDLTFSGHTHGMQMGIITRKFRWSPSKYYYPHWNGLYTEGRQYQYVNRGLGVLAIPFRIGMPPEITVVTLKSE